MQLEVELFPARHLRVPDLICLCLGLLTWLHLRVLISTTVTSKWILLDVGGVTGCNQAVGESRQSFPERLAAFALKTANPVRTLPHQLIRIATALLLPEWHTILLVLTAKILTLKLIHIRRQILRIINWLINMLSLRFHHQFIKKLLAINRTITLIHRLILRRILTTRLELVSLTLHLRLIVCVLKKVRLGVGLVLRLRQSV